MRKVIVTVMQSICGDSNSSACREEVTFDSKPSGENFAWQRHGDRRTEAQELVDAGTEVAAIVEEAT